MKKLILLLLLTLPGTLVFAADGDPDATFGTAGKVFATATTSDFTERVALQPDGKLVVAGYSSTTRLDFNFRCMVARFNADGSADTNYGTSGRTTVRPTNESCQLFDVAIQSDGKAVAVGLMGSKLVVMRFTSAGQPDTTFNGTGYNNNFAAFGYSIEVEQSTGKIVVGGAVVSVVGGTRYNFAMWRFNSNGTADTSFDGDGEVSTAIGIASLANAEGVTDFKILADGRYVGVGSTAVTGTSQNLTVVRYNNNGSLDTTLGGTGYAVKVLTSGASTGDSLVVQPDGKIVTVGFSNSGARTVTRLNADGSIDPTFGANGFSFSPNGSPFFEIALQADGKIVTAGRNFTTPTNYDFYVVRLTSSGAVDNAFGSGGTASTNFSTANRDEARSILVQPDGKIVVAGTSYQESVSNNTPYVIAIARYTSASAAANPALRVADFDGDGKTDPSLNRNGTWLTNPSGAPTSYSASSFGLATDKLASADYDGDGKTDLAVWRESNGNFYVLQSSNGVVRVENFGLAGDVPMPGDFDGDGKADLATYREGAQSYFFYRGSLNNPNGNITYLPWGTTGDKAVRGDFDGDGKLDPAVFRTSSAQWIIRRSSDAQIVYRNFGLATDKRVGGDFDGDGKSDIAVFRDGVWYILQSSNDQVRIANWGLASDTPAAGDYDGDGKTDVAVFRTGVFYVFASSSSTPVYVNFGAPGDIAVAASVNP